MALARFCSAATTEASKIPGVMAQIRTVLMRTLR
jgi:hypothetical protein